MLSYCYWMLVFPSGSIKCLSVCLSVYLSIYAVDIRFADLEEATNRAPRGILWCVLRDYRVPELFL